VTLIDQIVDAFGEGWTLCPKITHDLLVYGWVTDFPFRR
jgi:hypothetical protein